MRVSITVRGAGEGKGRGHSSKYWGFDLCIYVYSIQPLEQVYFRGRKGGGGRPVREVVHVCLSPIAGWQRCYFSIQPTIPHSLHTSLTVPGRNTIYMYSTCKVHAQYTPYIESIHACDTAISPSTKPC